MQNPLTTSERIVSAFQAARAIKLEQNKYSKNSYRVLSPCQEIRNPLVAIVPVEFMVLLTLGQPAESTNSVAVGAHPEKVPVDSDLEVLLETLMISFVLSQCRMQKYLEGLCFPTHPPIPPPMPPPIKKDTTAMRTIGTSPIFFFCFGGGE
ncbi:hypothetical protein BofuT4_P030960.1 [Botrytis cinerea T4]|uniref:Uncharacterized protein n=1 Tax=Botryotinia fuckeliana (strain T4) TaxID=999810 RepID=G2Y9E4_BOTF4|nr:hypothetical protein BofuT4_P030960.1 [Botrytis cinerea T4]